MSAATEARLEIARRRIASILTTYGVCSLRTLENKIADAGPYGMRVNPHLITEALRQLTRSDQVRVMERPTGNWYTLPSTNQVEVDSRLAQLEPIQRALAERRFVTRVGQALEIAIYRALASIHELDLWGGFLDLDEHGDDTPYKKEEPPSIWRRNRSPRGKLDFLVVDKHSSVAGGVEVKNGRPWIYPGHQDVKELLEKCCALDLVPILIGRRLHYTTTRLLVPRGGIVSETYYQRLPTSAANLAEQARNKELLGYHDIQLGNQPDGRMLRFAGQLASLLPAARTKFEAGGRAQLNAFAQGQCTLADLDLGP